MPVTGVGARLDADPNQVGLVPCDDPAVQLHIACDPLQIICAASRRPRMIMGDNRVSSTGHVHLSHLDGMARRRSVVPQVELTASVQVASNVAEDAAQASRSESSMSLREGLKLYPKAIGWSVLLSTAIVMDGFDLIIINSLSGLPAFQERFGHITADGHYEIPAAWQSGLAIAALVGQIIGLWIGGVLAERYGYRKTMIAALVAAAGFVFVVFFSQSLGDVNDIFVLFICSLLPL